MHAIFTPDIIDLLTQALVRVYLKIASYPFWMWVLFLAGYCIMVVLYDNYRARKHFEILIKREQEIAELRKLQGLAQTKSHIRRIK